MIKSTLNIGGTIGFTPKANMSRSGHMMGIASTFYGGRNAVPVEIASVIKGHKEARLSPTLLKNVLEGNPGMKPKELAATMVESRFHDHIASDRVLEKLIGPEATRSARIGDIALRNWKTRQTDAMKLLSRKMSIGSYRLVADPNSFRHVDPDFYDKLSTMDPKTTLRHFVSSLKRKGDIPGLIKCLLYTPKYNNHVNSYRTEHDAWSNTAFYVMEVVKAIGDLKAEIAVPLLKEIFSEPHGLFHVAMVQEEVAKALAKIGSDDAIDFLINLATGDETHAADRPRTSVLKAFSLLYPNERALNTLIEVLDDRHNCNSWIREPAAKAMLPWIEAGNQAAKDAWWRNPWGAPHPNDRMFGTLAMKLIGHTTRAMASDKLEALEIERRPDWSENAKFC